VFDVDAQDNFLNVPDLYNIALPPAYSAGAKVSTNSWYHQQAMTAMIALKFFIFISSSRYFSFVI
jgi:hypothetical protein